MKRLPLKQEFHKAVLSSPTIANLVLDGLEGHVKAAVAFLHQDKTRAKKKTFSPKVNVVRYRDDFVITAASQRILTD
jgi:RNA-directed DNA polymerase